MQVATASNSRPKVSEDYGGVETEEVKFEGLTVTLPVVLDTASVPQAKARMLEITARTIKDGPGDWSQKGRLLGQRLEYAIAERSAQGDIKDLKVCTSIAYSYQDPLLKRADGALMVVGTPPTAPQLRQVTFLEFVLAVAPSVLPKFRTSKIKPKSITAALRIPRVAGVVNLPRAVFSDPARLIAVIINTTGQQPEFLRLGAALGGRIEIDEEAVETALAEKRAEGYFHALVGSLGRSYVGMVVVNPAMDLQGCKQVMVTADGRMKCDSVERYFERFSAMLNVCDHSAPYPLSLSATFVSNAAPEIRAHLLAANWSPPDDSAANNATKEANLYAAKDAIVAAERAINNVRNIAGVSTTTRGRSQGPGVFVTVPGSGDVDHIEDDEETVEVCATVVEGAAETYAPRGTEDHELMDGALRCLVSNAEGLIARAAGANGGRRCHICDSPSHLMFACPDKNDPNKRAAARPFLRQLVANGSGTGGARLVVDEADWDRLGFSSLQEAERYAVVADSATSTAQRRSAIKDIRVKACNVAKQKRRREE